MSYRVVHYINQFFANIGGEEMAHVPPELRAGHVGPGLAFNQAWQGEAEVVATIVCGDSYYAEHEKDAQAQILQWVEEQKPDLFLAGPRLQRRPLRLCLRHDGAGREGEARHSGPHRHV